MIYCIHNQFLYNRYFCSKKKIEPFRKGKTPLFNEKYIITSLANVVCEISTETINYIKCPIKMFNQKLILRYIVNELYEMTLNQNPTLCRGERFHRTSGAQLF